MALSQPAGGPSIPELEISEQAQTFAWFSRPYALLEECAARFGERFILRVNGWGTQLMVSDPAAIRDVFRAGSDALLAGDANGFLRPLLGPSSLMLLDGEAHLRQRKLLLPAFQGARLAACGHVIQEFTRAVSMQWPTGQPVAIQERLLALSLAIILRVVFGLDPSDAHPLREAIEALLRMTSTSVAYAASAADERSSLRPILDKVERLLLAECAVRRAPVEAGDDVLSALLGARHEDGTLLQDSELRDQLLTLLLAGHETTAGTLTWALLLLLRTPRALLRLRQEVAELGTRPSPSAVVALPYLQAVLYEALRLYPVVPAISRRVQQPVCIGGMHLEPGVHVAPCIYLAHRRPARFPEPDCFIPERFLEGDYGPHEFLPFGGGIRRCIGMGFALYEMKLVLAELVMAFDFTEAARAPVRPVRKTVTVVPSEAGRVQLSRRCAQGHA